MYIQKAVSYLREEKIILYPTDTIWGIGGDATSEKAAEKIFRLKRRKTNQSFIILVDSIQMLKRYVFEIPPMVNKLLEIPYPTTIIYPKSRCLAPNILGEDGSIGIRLIRHKFCNDLIREFGKPIISTSANISGEKSPVEFRDIRRKIQAGVDYIIPLYEWVGNKVPSRIIRITKSGEIETLRH
ncbi:MAG: L-threonylcarbamoyladenylate synthase [Flavobacteriaceae bacterium]|nr:L-threonylcarbamoyladenylate synthase [Flavobacteriaceae bacterium]